MLWQFSGKRWIDVAEAHCNSAVGFDAYLVCPGPSLADVDPQRLRGPGRIVVAINTAYPRVVPDIWCAMDRPECYDPRIWREPCLKIVNGARKHEPTGITGLSVAQAPHTLMASVGRAHVSKLWAPDHQQFIANKNTFVFALSVLAFLGAKKIHLVGCDFGGSRDYYDTRQLNDVRRRTNRDLYAKLVGLLPIVRDAAGAAGVEIVSCTPDSPANAHLPYVELDEAIAASEQVDVERTGPVVHAHDAEACRWATEPPRGARGIVVGADEKQAWMLPWFVDNLRRSGCRLPLAITDFGLADQWRRRAREHALVFDPHGPASIAGWHLKPFALLRSPWRDSLWLDLDCQVLSDPTEIIDAGVSFGLTRDPHAKLSRPNGWATGVVVARRSEPVVEAWARSVAAGTHRGDQEALDALRDSVEPRTVELPRRYQRLRLDGPAHLDDVIYHWTGAKGKDEIRSMVNQRAGIASVTSDEFHWVTSRAASPSPLP